MAKTTTTIYHNPRCSKSRQALSLLEERNIDIEVVEYLKTPANADTLRELLNLLNLSPREILRTKEKEYKELGLDDPALTDEQIIEAMVKTPKLIERPIVVHNGRAAIGRPPEAILKLLD